MGLKDAADGVMLPEAVVHSDVMHEVLQYLSCSKFSALHFQV